MNTSERTGELLLALLNARANFQPIAKTKHVSVTTKTGRTYSFDYAPLDVIQAATEPALSAEGLVLVSGVMPGPEGTAAVSTRLMHAPSEQWLESCIPWGTFEDMKALGGFISYARRFSTVALLDLVGEDDLDATLADGDHVEPRARAQKSAAVGKLRPSEPVNGNGHTPPPEVDQDLEHPTEGHIAALANLALTECHEDKEVYDTRIRTIMRLKPQASVAPRLLTRTMSMAQYMELFSYYRRLEAQLARSQKDATSGTTSESSADPTATPAPAAEGPPVDPSPVASAAGSSSAPGPDPDDAGERERIIREAMDAGIAEKEARHIVAHHDVKAAHNLLLVAAKKRLQAVA